jgi:hypothetical protein
MNLDRYLKEDFEEEDFDDVEIDAIDDDMESIFNNFYNGNISDFKESLLDRDTLISFMNYVVRSGVSLKEIQRMLEILARR